MSLLSHEEIQAIVARYTSAQWKATEIATLLTRVAGEVHDAIVVKLHPPAPREPAPKQPRGGAIRARARVSLVVDVDAGSVWDGNASVAQIHKQASAEVAQALRALIEKEIGRRLLSIEVRSVSATSEEGI